MIVVKCDNFIHDIPGCHAEHPKERVKHILVFEHIDLQSQGLRDLQIQACSIIIFKQKLQELLW